MKVLVLFTLLLLFSHFTESQGREEEQIYDGSGHVTNVERLLSSGKVAKHNKGRRRYLRRRQRMVKWCASSKKAKEIDCDVEWKKIIGATVLVLGLVHILYFWHPVCNQDERML